MIVRLSSGSPLASFRTAGGERVRAGWHPKEPDRVVLYRPSAPGDSGLGVAHAIYPASARGLGQAGGAFVSSLASAIQQMEGWFPAGSPGYPTGSLSYRNNNPGNLRPGSLAVGATGSNNGYAVFPDFTTGWNALLGLIQSPAYWNLTLTQFFAQYAPAADNNNPAAYAATVAASLGVDPNTPISQLASGGGASGPTPASSASSGGDAGSSDDSGDASSGSSLADTFSSISDTLSGASPVAWGVLGAVVLAAFVL